VWGHGCKKLENSGLNRQVGDGAEPTEKGLLFQFPSINVWGNFWWEFELFNSSSGIDLACFTRDTFWHKSCSSSEVKLPSNHSF
jgi:hypothetical protein